MEMPPLREDREKALSQEQLKSAVQSKYYALVSEGSSPNSAAATAIREIGSHAKLLLGDSPMLGQVEEVAPDAEQPSPQKLRFDDLEEQKAEAFRPSSSQKGVQQRVLEDQRNIGMQKSSSTPTVPIATSAACAESSASSTILFGGSRKVEQHRNRDVWKVFGIHLPAGRSLKNLYGGGKLEPLPGALMPAHKNLGPPSDIETYIAVNGMKVGSAGLQYRKSMNIFDICHGEQECVRWGDLVEGYRVDACWLQVGDRYLPLVVNKVQLLKRWGGQSHLRPDGLTRQQALPPLRGLPKVRSCPKLEVAGVPYRW